MPPMTQLDRIERGVAEIRSQQVKDGKTLVLHGEKIKQLEDDGRTNKARIWSMALLLLGAMVTAGVAAATRSKL